MAQRFKLGGHDHVNQKNSQYEGKNQTAEGFGHFFLFPTKDYPITRRQRYFIDLLLNLGNNLTDLSSSKMSCEQDFSLLVLSTNFLWTFHDLIGHQFPERNK